ncbi:ATP-dependent DNA helicase RecG [Caproicibacterium amylolyticum]|uniref:ATP-dependent DNA helicase RecG n=1 Tax=Caproicibacterium amylolyticum TaxID=2766537 RepID=A0A7G9WHX5_9FIRM|nr:ATP-dependent DNA helicase RecG [Caproicibacterium amylolyticum]QNO18287.1 ATP-dependent DNA helicase RecG [Caproicibacterium amylolyticum]
MASLFAKPITELKGVGSKRAELFQKLGVPTAGALLRLYPRAYEDWSNPYTVLQAPLDIPCAVRATVKSVGAPVFAHSGVMLTHVHTADEEGTPLELTFFNNQYIQNLLSSGIRYIFYGKITLNQRKRQMAAPVFAKEGQCPGLRPIYPQTKGLSSRIIEAVVKETLQLLPDVMRDPIPQEIRQQYSLCELRYALESIHQPENTESMEVARRRLAFEELLVLQLGLLTMKSRTREKSGFVVQKNCLDDFWKLLPFSPTSAQKRAAQEAVADMQSGWPMNRLVQGDVGSGKTAVAAACCHTVIQNGMQAVLMAPTDILAHQHYDSLTKMLEPAGIRVGLLTGSMKAKEKAGAKTGILDGTIQLLIGTHALLTPDVQFQNLGLVITDEQHRFGVNQRTALAEKSKGTHVLVMSATPIPRTLALMIYGDLDISVIDELPPGRQVIETFCVDSAKRVRALHFLQKHVHEGQQAYVICPAIDAGNDKASVAQYAEYLQKVLPDCRIGALHGRMKPKEKDEIMGQFSAGKIDILVSTTVVEVGVDVPNAVDMLIENAEQYGLSQLHQLRGRVGRGSYQSYCILITDAQNEDARARMEVMCETSNGFTIAERDLKLRGPGDFFGQRQHGLPELKIADMNNDFEVLKDAQSVAKEMLAADPPLEGPEHRGLRAEVRQLFRHLGET